MVSAACAALAAFWVLANAAAFFLARRDKRAAQRRRRSTRRARGAGAGARVPERTFHALALLGGGPGGALAFVAYRHKTRKWRFLLPWGASAALGLVLTWAWAGLVCEGL